MQHVYECWADRDGVCRDGCSCSCHRVEQAARANIVQPGLRVGRYLTISQRFDEWMTTTDGQIVYDELVRRARLLRERGFGHYSHKAIIEAIRYDRNLDVGPSHGFKINDHFSSRLARLAMREHPFLRGFFEIRELRS